MEDWLARNRGHILWTLVNLTSVGLFFLLMQRSEPTPMQVETPIAATPTTQLLRAYVSGAVATPDVYVLEPGAIVKDALSAAGGSSAEADLDRINLALPVRDGDHVYVPRKAEAASMPPLPAQSGAAEKININRASLSELEALPGIGAVYAQRILDYRKQHGFFSSVEELSEVKGIGSSTLDGFRELVTVH